MRSAFLFSVLPVVIGCILTGCAAFNHGLTWSRAENSYHLVTGDKNNFGDRRIRYNKGFHRNSSLTRFLDCECGQRERPEFIYEYETVAKTRGIKLFYVQRDSVFVFEEPKKGNLQSVLKEYRKMEDAERKTYELLKAGERSFLNRTSKQ